MSSIFSHLWGGGQDYEVDTDRVIPLPNEEDGGEWKDDSNTLEEKLRVQKDYTRQFRLALSNSYLERAKLSKTFATYHQVTWGIITIIPLVNSLIRRDVGIVLSIFSFASLLMVSNFYIMQYGHQAGDFYQMTALDLSNLANLPSDPPNESEEEDFSPD